MGRVLTRSNFLSTSNAGAAASGKVTFSTYLQTANVRGGARPARPEFWSLYPSFPEAVQETYPGRLRVWTPTLERTTSCGPRLERAKEILTVVKRRVAWALCGPSLVSSTGDAGCSENVPGMSKCSLRGPRLRRLLAVHSRSVVMKVETCSEVCNNSPAEASGSENEWHSRVLLTPSRLRYVDSLVVARLEERLKRLRLSHVEGYQGAPSLSLPSGGQGGVQESRSGESRGRCPLESRSGLQ